MRYNLHVICGEIKLPGESPNPTNVPEMPGSDGRGDVGADLKSLGLTPKMWLGVEIKWFSPQVVKFY